MAMFSKYNNPNRRRHSRKMDRSDADIIASKMMFDDWKAGREMPLAECDKISDQLYGKPSCGIYDAEVKE